MNQSLVEIVSKLESIREDVDAMDHHQTDRVVGEIEEVIKMIKTMDPLTRRSLLNLGLRCD